MNVWRRVFVCSVLRGCVDEEDSTIVLWRIVCVRKCVCGRILFVCVVLLFCVWFLVCVLLCVWVFVEMCEGLWSQQAPLV